MCIRDRSITNPAKDTQNFSPSFYLSISLHVSLRSKCDENIWNKIVNKQTSYINYMAAGGRLDVKKWYGDVSLC